MDRELEEFRKDWIQSVHKKALQPKVEAETEAMQLFKQAVKLEVSLFNKRSGSFADAISHYKRAIRLDPDVEFAYNGLPQHRNAQIPPAPDQKELEIQDITDVIQKIDLKNRAPRTRICYLFKLPVEIITDILVKSIHSNVNAAMHISLCCRKLYDISNSQAVFRKLCCLAHAQTEQELSTFLIKYDNCWRYMWLRKPRIRLDGVYISKVTYKRTGWSDTLTYIQPTHLVKYYRYLRFLTKSTFILLNTPQEPTDIVNVWQAD